MPTTREVLACIEQLMSTYISNQVERGVSQFVKLYGSSLNTPWSLQP